MIEGPIQIVLSHKEVDKTNLWLKPRIGRDGYDLLYFGANGWAPLVDCPPPPPKKFGPRPPKYPEVELKDCKSPLELE